VKKSLKIFFCVVQRKAQFKSNKRAARFTGIDQEQLDDMQSRLDNTHATAQYRLAWLNYSEARYRLLAYLAAGQTQLNLWTVPFEGIESIENNLQDWEQFMILGVVLQYQNLGF